MPAILVEVGYLSHPDESEDLVTEAYQEKAAQALAHGILGYLIKKGLISEKQTLTMPPPAAALPEEQPASPDAAASQGKSDSSRSDTAKQPASRVISVP